MMTLGPLQEWVELGEYFVSDHAVEVIHQRSEVQLADPRNPITCEPPWLCERYLDSELWLELFLRLGDGKPDLRAVIGLGELPADAWRLLVHSLAPYVVGTRDRRRNEDRAMFRYVPKNFESPQRVPKAACPLRSVVWLHPMDEFDRLRPNAMERDAVAFAETLGSRWPREDDRKRRFAARPVGTHLADQVVQRRSEVYDKVAEQEAEFVRRRFRGGDENAVIATLVRPTIFADEVRLTVPERVDGRVEQTAMMVRPLDLRAYDTGPRLALEPPVQIGTDGHG